MALAVAGCTQAGLETPVARSGSLVLTECPTGTEASFFPPGVLLPLNAADDVRQRSALTQYLSSAGVEPLWCGGPEIEAAYRLLWFTAFGDAALVTLSDAGGTASLDAFEFFHPKDDPKRAWWAVTRRVHRELALSESSGLLLKVGQSKFWTIEPATETCEGCSDGVTWLIEGRAGSLYRVVTRVPSDDAIVSFGRELVRVAGIKLPFDRSAALP